MPRNVVTISRRWFPSKRREQQRIFAEIAKRHRPTPDEYRSHVALDFSKQEPDAVVRQRVVGWLDEINPAWQRYVVVYPRVENLRSRGRQT